MRYERQRYGRNRSITLGEINVLLLLDTNILTFLRDMQSIYMCFIYK